MSRTVIVPYFGENPLREEALIRVMRHLSDSGLDPCFFAGGNPAAARNNGARETGDDVLVFNDADSLVPAVQIREAARLADTGPGLVYAYTLYLRGREHIFNAPSFGCAAIRRSCFDELGGFDETLETHEDVDFAMRSQQRWPVRRVDGILEHIGHGGRDEDGVPADVDKEKARAARQTWEARWASTV